MTKRTRTTWFVGGVLVALLLAGLAWPVMADTRPSQPQLGVASPAFSGSSPLVIPAAEFRSDGFDPDSIFFSFSSGYFRGERSNSCLMAPVNLPQFAEINSIYVSAYDNDSDSGVNMWVRLYRVDNYSGNVDDMAYMETTSESTDIQILSDPSINYGDVSYPYYSYYVGACLESSATRLYSVRIYYSQKLVFLPVVQRE